MGKLYIYMMILIIVVGSVLSACGNKSVSDSENVPSTVSDTIDATIVYLTDTVGDPDTLQASDMIPPERAAAAAQDYGPRTGKWFEGEHGFNLITSFSSGEIKAGSAVGAALGSIPEGRSVRFQLTSRDKAGQRIKLIKEYSADIQNTVNGRVDFAHKMPDQPNTNYLLSIEILSSENVVEDTWLTPLFVPAYELNARLTVKPPAEASDETNGSGQTILTLYNAGPTDLYFGYGYDVYRKVPEGWKVVPIHGEVASIAMHLKPGESFQEKVELSAKLEPGQYRIVKHIQGYMTDLTSRLAADFIQ
ncbi:immunoglobulin-like domain-containing protein [Paenibacillus eucommiae]|uniref:Bacterial Ig-like domain-containing protein n=1 Tax=Paenibacillus eucommiae TaxID=1355755 RepID=A0ABS4J4X2_9BACL|nr:immunoglobulin-like domain-containing protein [Paenibacillus eucommiae]MBP1994882.1 hypothetical protein [Paenibacillus eucommiae]